MLAIRLQRLGRKAAPVYRLAVQESQRHPSSGRVVAYVGAYNPHSKETKIDKEKVDFYLKNGAQPTPRVVKILLEQKIDLPAWVVKARSDKQASVRKPEKLRKNQPKEQTSTEPELKAEEPEAETPDEPASSETTPEPEAKTEE